MTTESEIDPIDGGSPWRGLGALGFTKEELQERVVARVADQALSVHISNADGLHLNTELAERLEQLITDRIDATIEALADEHLLPNIQQHIENVTLQKTNEWGEPKGKAKTFVEYLVERAENYMTEPVDFKGLTREERGYGWSKAQTRIVYLIDNHIQYHIAVAVKSALQHLNGAVADGLAQTVKAQLAETIEKLEIEVKK